MSVALGAIYTRPWTVELILDLAGYHPEADLVGALAVEPAAGDGAFLMPMVERLLRVLSAPRPVSRGMRRITSRL